MRRLFLPLLFLSVVCPATAQFDPERLQVGLHLQTASYAGERSAYKGAGGLGSGFGLEGAYGFSTPIGMLDAVLRIDRAVYPGIVAGRPGYPAVTKVESSESRTRMMAYARRVFATPWSIQPYAALGLATVSGTVNDEKLSGWGPVLGLGVLLPVGSGRVTLFAEFLSHMTLPNDGADLAGGDGSSPDRLRTFSAGVRYRIGAPAQRTRLVVRSPRRARLGEEMAYEAEVASDRADAYTVRWVFGDGAERVGNLSVHAYDEPGSYTVLVSATDGSETIDRRVTVTVPALLSIRLMVPETAVARESVSLSSRLEGGMGGGDRAVAWDFGDGSVAEGGRVRHTYENPGTYAVKVQATDGPETATGTTMVTVSPPPPVTLEAEIASGGAPGDALRFTADPDGGARGAEVTVTWTFGDGEQASGTRVRHAYTAPGVYSVEVTATDGTTTASRSATVEIVAPPPPPPELVVREEPAREQPVRPAVQEQIRAEPPPVEAPKPVLRSVRENAPATGEVGERLAFSVSTQVENPAAAPVVRWTFGDGATAEGPAATHAYAAAGRYAWSVRVTLGEQSIARDGSVEVKARPAPPVTVPPARVQPEVVTPPAVPPTAQQAQLDVLEIAQAPMRPKAGEEVAFSPVVRGANYACSWDFGDGTTADVCEARHAYAQTGRYTYRLRVSNGGSSAAFTKEINVESNRCVAIDRLHSVNFFANSSELIPDMRTLLRENVELLIGCPGQEIVIMAAATPDEQDAERLANQRALSVYQFYRLLGIPSNRFAAQFDIRVDSVSNVDIWQQRYARTSLR